MRDLCVFDLDGTLITHDSFNQLVMSKIATKPQLALGALARRLGLLSRSAFSEMAHRKLIRDVNPDLYFSFVAATVESVIPERLLFLNEWRQKGAYVVLLSASPQEYVKEIGKILGFDAAHGSHWIENRYIHLHGPTKRIFLDAQYPPSLWVRKFAIADSPSDDELLSCFQIAITVSNEETTVPEKSRVTPSGGPG